MTRGIGKKITIVITSIAIASVFLGFSSFPMTQNVSGAAPPPCSEERVSVTIDFEDYELKVGEVLVLLDTTGSGFLCVVHVAVNLPCDEGQDGIAGNQEPPLLVVAGIAGGALSGVIDDASDDTSFTGTLNSCVYHDTLFATSSGQITDVIIANLGEDDVDLKQVVVTITGTYEASEGGR